MAGAWYQCLMDAAFTSTTDNVAVATGAFDGPLIFGVHTRLPGKDWDFMKSVVEMEVLDEYNDEAPSRTFPASVDWVSQYPGEGEWLWPTCTLFHPMPSSARNRVLLPNEAPEPPPSVEGGEYAAPEVTRLPPGKQLFEFVGAYGWDEENDCPKVDPDLINDAFLRPLKIGLTLPDVFAMTSVLGLESLRTEERHRKEFFWRCDTKGSGTVTLDQLVGFTHALLSAMVVSHDTHEGAERAIRATCPQSLSWPEFNALLESGNVGEAVKRECA
eukprot:NODE_1885_length_1043_cov_101.681087_g1531_i0.p1 GENE.NODE_1885_length_1043_cov_101.681087_g1531_i0~~NODE_1885_length_1043_cov_101.681087_g1531_i0.p1  ORF type:complete len:272 (+),score=67.92 NODE_1885_length_1043_cov_101.681087_g1531_i0:89-904(+)